LFVTNAIKNIVKPRGIAPGPPFQNLAGGILKYKSIISTPRIINKMGRNSYCPCKTSKKEKKIVMIVIIPIINPSAPSVNSAE